MLIYVAFLIPLVAVILLTTKFAKKITWWEYLLVFGIPAIIIIPAKFISTYSQIWNPEYWNNYIIQATYYEYWNEWIHKTCYHTCYDKCKDSNGRSYDCNPHDCRPYDCSYQENHPAYWEAIDNQGHTLSVNQSDFLRLCQQWNNKTFKDMNRSYYTVDGNAFVTKVDTFLNIQFHIPLSTFMKTGSSALDQFLILLKWIPRMSKNAGFFHIRSFPSSTITQFLVGAIQPHPKGSKSIMLD